MAYAAALPACLYLALSLLPARQANRRVRRYGRALQSASALAMLSATIALIWLVARRGAAHDGPVAERNLLAGGGVYFDGLAATMVLLICTLGAIVVRFSLRYLDGDPAQGRFLKWMSLTLGAALWLVIASDLLALTIAWMLTSFGLHQLLIHYPDRSWAIWAARKKFVISRLGDALLLSAVALCYAFVGSTDFDTLFRAAASPTPDRGVTWSLIGCLLVLGAMTKSAQFPFHSWLPDTMETPTPVSALMHAGIINAGGFLVLRLSPVLEQAPAALVMLALCGMLTAILGSVTMLTQTSVKRALAYSTIAQMGFMMLQCGLGAYSAALLHLVAHSLYKAHAFLRSGSVATAHAAPIAAVQPTPTLVQLPFAVAAAGTCVAGAAWLSGTTILAKTGGSVLAVILTLALTHFVWQAFGTRSGVVIFKALVTAGLVAVSYCVGLTFAHVVMASTSVSTSAPRAFDMALSGVVLAGFLALWWLQTSVAGSSRALAKALHVHALHGFYLDIPARRMTAWIWGLKAPVP